MKPRLIFSLCPALLCVVSASVAAQGPELRAGTRIRFTVGASDALHVADVTRINGDSVFVDRCLTCTQLSYSRAELSHLAIFQAIPSGMRILSGIGIGGLVGLGVGLAGASSCTGGDRCDGWIVLVPFGAIAGGFVGGLVGYLTSYRWVPIERSGATSLR